MPSLSKWAQKLGLPYINARWDTFVAASTYEHGSIAVDNNGVAVAAHPAYGWYPLHGMVPWEKAGWPSDTVGTPTNTTKDIDTTVTSPFRGHWVVTMKFDLVYPVATNTFLQQWNMNIGVNPEEGSGTFAYFNRIARIHRANASGIESMPLSYKALFHNVSEGVHTLRLRVIGGGGNAGSLGQIYRGRTKISFVPLGGICEIDGVQVG